MIKRTLASCVQTTFRTCQYAARTATNLAAEANSTEPEEISDATKSKAYPHQTETKETEEETIAELPSFFGAASNPTWTSTTATWSTAEHRSQHDSFKEAKSKPKISIF